MAEAARWCLRFLVILAAVLGALYLVAQLWAMIGGLVPLVGLGALMSALVADQLDDLAESVVRGLEQVQQWTTGPPLDLGDDDLGALVADAVGIGVGLALLGVPLALPLAVITFVGAFVPVVGAVVTGILAVLVALVTEGVTTALIVLGLVAVVQQLESNVLSPLLTGRGLALHPALTIAAVTAGGTLAGVAGAFLAVPALAVTTTLARYAKEQVDQVDPAVPRPVDA